MTHKRQGKENSQGLRERIQQLEEKLAAAQTRDGPGQAPAEGLANGILAALGKMVPGLGKLIETASQTSEFRDRLAGIDEEVKRRFKEPSLGRAAAALGGAAGRRQIGIPPSVRRAGGGRNASAGVTGASFAKSASRGAYRQPRGPRVHISPQTPAQLAVDVFDEGARVVVLAEAPGLRREDLAVSLDGTVLLISIEAPHRKGLQRIELPCEVAGGPEVSLANGILNVQLRKADCT